MTKVDFKKELKHLYAPSAKAISVVDVPPMNFLMVDGSGNPNTSPEYAEAVEALYAVAYAIKFKIKKSAGGVDYGVMPLEGLWWADDQGSSAQTLHVGSYDDEGPAIARMHAFIDENGYRLRGKHHEIYLNDARKTAPEKLRTVLRQPFQRR